MAPPPLLMRYCKRPSSFVLWSRHFIFIPLFFLAAPATVHGAPTAQAEASVSQLPHSTAFMSLLARGAPYMSTDQLEEFLHQFSSEAASTLPANRRALQIAPSSFPFAPEDATDAIAPEAHNGWIDQQEWRSFASDIGKPGERDQSGSVHVHYVTARGTGDRGGVVLSVGHGEPVEKYAEQLHDLIVAGFSPVYALDHRGQGRSTRLLDDDSFKSHVEEAADFVADFRQFVALVDAEMDARSEGGGKRFLHCHSMGCAVAFTYLIDEYYAQRANVFHAVAANAPLIKPVTDPFPYSVAVTIGRAMVALGLGESYPPTKGGSFHELYAFESSRPDRQNLAYANCHAQHATSYDAGHTGLCLGDVTGRFASEFFGMYDTFADFTRGSLTVPILLQQARTDEGGSDGVVVNEPQRTFCTSACVQCTLTQYPDSAHNIWFETDAVRTPALAEVYAFYNAHGASAPPAQSALPRMCHWLEFWCAGEGCGCIWSCSHPASRC